MFFVGCRMIEIVEPDVTSFIVCGLRHDALYNFRVYAETEGGMGDALVLRSLVRINKHIGGCWGRRGSYRMCGGTSEVV